MAAPSDPESFGVEVWRGGANAWECDENGHLNVRFYLAKAAEALVGLTAELGLAGAFSPRAGATLVPRETHIRYHREVRAGGALHIRGGVLALGESDARLLFVLIHSHDGAVAATVRMAVEHVTPADAKPFPWPARAIDRAAAITATAPAYAAPRGVDLATAPVAASWAQADALGLVAIASGAVLPQDCDVFGRMRIEQFLGRASDGVERLAAPIRQRVAEARGAAAARLGGVALESRLAHRRWPCVGDRVVIRSGVAGADRNTYRLVHWLLDPDGGQAFGSNEVVAAVFDLDARKVVPLPPPVRAALEESAVKALTAGA